MAKYEVEMKKKKNISKPNNGWFGCVAESAQGQADCVTIAHTRSCGRARLTAPVTAAHTPRINDGGIFVCKQETC